MNLRPSGECICRSGRKRQSMSESIHYSCAVLMTSTKSSGAWLTLVTGSATTECGTTTTIPLSVMQDLRFLWSHTIYIRTPLIQAYFCGQHRHCVLYSDREALTDAMANLDRYYTVVGTLERLAESYRLLERLLPKFFGGLSQLNLGEKWELLCREAISKSEKTSDDRNGHYCIGNKTCGQRQRAA